MRVLHDTIRTMSQYEILSGCGFFLYNDMTIENDLEGALNDDADFADLYGTMVFEGVFARFRRCNYFMHGYPHYLMKMVATPNRVESIAE